MLPSESSHPHVYSAEVVRGALQYSSQPGEETEVVDLSDIVCVLPGYQVLFLQTARLRRIAIRALPSALSPFLIPELPNHLNSSQAQQTRVQIVISTRSGTGSAQTVFQNLLQPLLAQVGCNNAEIYETQSEQTILELAHSQFLERACDGVRQTIILLAGDGGLIDIVNVFYKSGRTIKAPPHIALIPCGTGNALASSIGLRSGPVSALQTLLRGRPSPIPIFVAKFSRGSQQIVDDGRQRAPIDTDPLQPHRSMYGAVVASWGLHAALVADSETSEYRQFGPQRFQMAAKELLYPSDGTQPHRFQGSITLTPAPGQNGQEHRIEDREHMYALVTLVPRLEKEFLISPDSVSLSGQMRLIRFGPMPAEEAMHLMSLAYQDGRHVREKTVTYVEVDRVRIDFHEDQEKWRRVCVDGKIVVVEREGWMEICKERRRLLYLIVDQTLQ